MRMLNCSSLVIKLKKKDFIFKTRMPIKINKYKKIFFTFQLSSVLHYMLIKLYNCTQLLN